MANAEKLLRALLPKAYKLEDGELESLLNDSTTDADGIALVLEKDKTRIAEISKPKPGQTFQDGYKKAKAETLTALETELKTEYGIETDAQGVELVKTIVTEKTKAAGKAKELTDDDVKKHPVYQEAEKAHKKALKETTETWETKFNTRESEFKKENTVAAVGKKALEILKGMNPVLSGNPKVASNIEKTFLDSFRAYEYDLQDNGNRVVVLDKEGKVVDDGHGHSLDFEKFVKDNAGNFYEFKANNGGGNAGNGDPNKDKDKGAGGGGTGGAEYPKGITKPKTQDEMYAIVNNYSIPAKDRAIVFETWETEQKASGQ